MIRKTEVIRIQNSKDKTGFPIRFRIHWDNELEQYVLCRGTFIVQHYTIEECEDMLKILRKYNK